MMGRKKGQKVGPLYGCREKETGRGAWLYLARIEARLTINELAGKTGVSARTIKRIEKGEPWAGYRVEGILRRFLKIKRCR